MCFYRNAIFWDSRFFRSWNHIIGSGIYKCSTFLNRPSFLVKNSYGEQKNAEEIENSDFQNLIFKAAIIHQISLIVKIICHFLPSLANKKFPVIPEQKKMIFLSILNFVRQNLQMEIHFPKKFNFEKKIIFFVQELPEIFCSLRTEFCLSKMIFVAKIEFFRQNWFFVNIEIFCQNWNFLSKFNFFVKTEICSQNWIFSWKLNFFVKIDFFAKIFKKKNLEFLPVLPLAALRIHTILQTSGKSLKLIFPVTDKVQFLSIFQIGPSSFLRWSFSSELSSTVGSDLTTAILWRNIFGKKRVLNFFEIRQ